MAWLMEFLPEDHNVRDSDFKFETLETYKNVGNLTISRLPVPIVDEYIYLGIRMTKSLTIKSLVEHRVK